MKSADEPQAKTPELNLKTSSLSPLHEWKEKKKGDPIAFLIHFATRQ